MPPGLDRRGVPDEPASTAGTLAPSASPVRRHSAVVHLSSSLPRSRQGHRTQPAKSTEGQSSRRGDESLGRETSVVPKSVTGVEPVMRTRWSVPGAAPSFGKTTALNWGVRP